MTKPVPLMGGYFYHWLSGRSWCRDLCPLGALTSRLSRFNPFFRVKSNPTSCHPCAICTRACPRGADQAFLAGDVVLGL